MRVAWRCGRSVHGLESVINSVTQGSVVSLTTQESVDKLSMEKMKIERAVKPARPFDSNGYTVVEPLHLSLIWRNV